jgi:hypothetical protein
VAKNKAKGGKAPQAEPDDGIRRHDRKILDKFLGEVVDGLWGVGPKDRESALKALKAHIMERYRPHQSDHAMEMAVSSLGSPEVLAKGIRTLYGYGTRFKVILVVVSFIFGLATIPMVGAWSIIGPWSILGLLAAFLLLTSVGPQVGLKWGGLMGLAAASSRVLLLLGLMASLGDDYTIGTGQAVVDFTLVSLFLLLVGLLAGHIRETSIKDYIQGEIV